jgi:hypothetical protein
MTEKNDQDHVFKFAVDELDPPRRHKDNFAEMIRQQLSALLNVVVFTQRGKDVRIDGFRFINEPDATFEIFEND